MPARSEHSATAEAEKQVQGIEDKLGDFTPVFSEIAKAAAEETKQAAEKVADGVKHAKHAAKAFAENATAGVADRMRSFFASDHDQPVAAAFSRPSSSSSVSDQAVAVAAAAATASHRSVAATAPALSPAHGTAAASRDVAVHSINAAASENAPIGPASSTRDVWLTLSNAARTDPPLALVEAISSGINVSQGLIRVSLDRPANLVRVQLPAAGLVGKLEDLVSHSTQPLRVFGASVTGFVETRVPSCFVGGGLLDGKPFTGAEQRCEIGTTSCVSVRTLVTSGHRRMHRSHCTHCTHSRAYAHAYPCTDAPAKKRAVHGNTGLSWSVRGFKFVLP